MTIAIAIIVSGLTLGSMYAVSSVSLSLLWGTLGVLNMAQGAFLVIGAYAAFTATSMFGLPAPLAILFTVLVGALTGFITYFGLVRFLMNRPGFETAVIIGTFGLSLIVQNLVLRSYGAYPFSQPLAVTGGFNFGQSYIPYQNVVIFLASILIMIVVALILNRTRMGRAIRATAQNGAAAQLMGVPVGRIFLQVFLIAGVLAAVSGTMLSSITTLSPTMGYDPMLKAFIVCVVAGLGNVYGALAASFMIGLIEAAVEYYLGVKYGFPMLLLLIILTLIWRPAGIFGHRAVARAMIKRDIVIGVIMLAIAAAVPFVWPERYVLLELTLFFIYTTVVTQWNLVFGVAGVFSLAQMAIFAMGGYVTGMLGLYLNWSLWVAMPGGAVAAVIFSVIIGVACLRLGGAYVALLTFAIAEAMYLLIITDTECFFMEGVTCRNFTGGTRGLVNFGNFGFQQLLGYKYAAFGNYFLALALLALATAFSVFVIRSPVGMAFAALRDNTTYAVARGIGRFKYQLLVFAASALFTGLAGAVYAGYFSVMGADMLNLTLLLLLLSMMVVGGLGKVWGPIAGAATLTLVNEGLNEFVDWRLLGLGLILILFIIFWPAGIVGAIEAAFARLGPKRIAPQPRRALGSRSKPAPGRRAERKATVEVAAPEPVLRIESILGEGPVWSEDEQALYWLDVFLPALNRFDPAVGINKATPLDRPIYAMALRSRGGAIGAFEDGIGFVDLDGGTIEIFGDPKAGSPVNFNDGKCDRRGRFWTGTMAKDWSSPIGGLYCVEPSQKITQMDGEIILSNGLGWSPDDRTMYFTDFGRRVIYAYDFDVDTGAVSKRRPFIEIPQDAGFPDGMTIDAEGCLWVAHWDGWRVTRYGPDGKLRQTIRMPVKRPTSCTFGGPDLSILYVTSARMGLTEAELAAAPLSGSVFAIRSDTVGLAEPKFPA